MSSRRSRGPVSAFGWMRAIDLAVGDTARMRDGQELLIHEIHPDEEGRVLELVTAEGVRVHVPVQAHVPVRMRTDQAAANRLILMPVTCDGDLQFGVLIIRGQEREMEQVLRKVEQELDRKYPADYDVSDFMDALEEVGIQTIPRAEYGYERLPG